MRVVKVYIQRNIMTAAKQLNGNYLFIFFFSPADELFKYQNRPGSDHTFPILAA